jgi:hypothetical protein
VLVARGMSVLSWACAVQLDMSVLSRLSYWAWTLHTHHTLHTHRPHLTHLTLRAHYTHRRVELGMLLIELGTSVFVQLGMVLDILS